MTWEAGDHGCQMRLSAEVPAYLEENIASFAKRLTGAHLLFNQCTWAVHPGGRAILEAIEKACHLQREQMSASWQVLNDYGNMSSPTFLFVLKEILKTPRLKEVRRRAWVWSRLIIEGIYCTE